MLLLGTAGLHKQVGEENVQLDDALAGVCFATAAAAQITQFDYLRCPSAFEWLCCSDGHKQWWLDTHSHISYYDPHADRGSVLLS